ncbi:hypothetical protein B7494_g3108 [Chlorociboria aeruginascens]|nr:hypothetical protein B7494_g3108 [Chlorociboria aeruginascens]
MSQFIPIQVQDHSIRVPPPPEAPPVRGKSTMKSTKNNPKSRFHDQCPSAPTPKNSSPTISSPRTWLPASSRDSSTTASSRSLRVVRPTNEQPSRLHLRRINPNDNDVVISSSGIHHNAKQVIHGFSKDGKTEAVPSKYFDFVAELSNMSPDDTKNFWNRNWVDIVINLDGVMKGAKGQMGKVEKSLRCVLDNIVTLTKSNSGFVSHAKRIRVLINFAPKASYTSIKSIKASNEYGLIKELVDKLESLPSLDALQVHIRSPAASPKHLSNHRLAFILPFYTLSFTNWTLKYQVEGMRIAFPLPRAFQDYLDDEAEKEKDKAWKVVAVNVSQVMPVSWNDLPHA